MASAKTLGDQPAVILGSTQNLDTVALDNEGDSHWTIQILPRAEFNCRAAATDHSVMTPCEAL
jgi:hypothetical protein